MTSFKISKKVFIASVVTIVILVSSVFVYTISQPKPLAGVRVAVYDDRGTTDGGYCHNNH
jgi:hypothetical protein